MVINPSVSDSTLTPGQSFTIYATVENQGNGSSSSTTLRYYRSTNSIISTGDTLLGTDAVSALSPNGTSPENLPTTAPNTDGTYWVGACVDAVSGESPTNNQCSTGVEITVAGITSTGSLRVIITPSAAVSAGAKCRVDGGTWQDSGATVSGLSVGSHTVDYKHLVDWIEPGSEMVTITGGQTLQLTRQYERIPKEPKSMPWIPLLLLDD